MTGRLAREWRATFDDLFDTLVAAQGERNQRNEFVDGELQWVTYERQVMVDRVNLLRSRRGAGPVSIEHVRRKEQSAAGHIDYTKKFALGCADLAFGEIAESGWTK